MATAEQIRLALEQMAKSQGPEHSNLAKVKSVNQEKATCVLEDEDGQEILDVRLRPVLNGKNSFLQIPKVGTQVLAIRIENEDQWMVVACDEIDKVAWYCGNSVFEIDAQGFLLKKENETLKMIVVDLVNAIQSIQLTVSTTGTAAAQTGQTTSLVNTADFESIKTRINQFLK